MRESSLHDSSDGIVVSAVLDGHPEAYAIIVRRYQDKLYRHAERMTGVPDEAMDIVQTTFIKAYKNLEHCRNADQVGAWLFRINANECRDYLKSPRSKGLRLDGTSTLVSESENPERTVVRAEIHDRVSRALDRLSPEEREAFVLKHIEDSSYLEMAELLGASVSALKMRVHRAREALQELLESYR